MKIRPKQYALSLFESLKDKDKKEAEEIIKKFAQVLVDNNQASQVEKIISYFSNLWGKENGLVEAEIVSARKLDNKVVKLLNDYIVRLSDAKKVSIEERVDPNIIGGVVIKYGDKIMDNSLKTEIRDFKRVIAS